MVSEVVVNNYSRCVHRNIEGAALSFREEFKIIWSKVTGFYYVFESEVKFQMYVAFHELFCYRQDYET